MEGEYLFELQKHYITIPIVKWKIPAGYSFEPLDGKDVDISSLVDSLLGKGAKEGQRIKLTLFEEN